MIDILPDVSAASILEPSHGGSHYPGGLIRDVSERCALAHGTCHLADRDPVTGLDTVDKFIDRVDSALGAGGRLTIIVVMLVGVYRIGEHHGRAAAKHVLRTVSSRLRTMSDDDLPVVRIDGELFATATADPDVAVVAARLRSEIARPIPWKGHELHVVVGAGAAQACGVLGAAEDQLRAALAAANDALRHHARGGVSLFTPELGRRLDHEARVEDRLHAAVTAGALSLAMQAKVRAADGHILGAEALVRWTDDLLGPVPPSEFIPLAERTGLICDLTAWVIDRALAEAALWQQDGLDLTIAVNLSAMDLGRSDLVPGIRSAIAASGCDPHRVIVELTESAVAENPDEAVMLLRTLKDLGLSLALDDFGTGYSSLSYLRRFPIDTLKIDRSFVADTPEDADAVGIARSIVALARSLGMSTVAEGVESRAQAGFLRDLGVDALQGYLFSRPVSPGEFRAQARAGSIDSLS